MITYRDLFDAIEQNGLPKFVGDYFGDIDNNATGIDSVRAACALGQAFINLRKIHPDTPSDVHRFFDDGGFNEYPLTNDIARWNDLSQMSLAEIANKGRERYSDQLDEPLPFAWNLEN